MVNDMLKDLEVLNGTLSLKFDPLNTKYTIILNKDEDKVNFKYILDDDTAMMISGNQKLNNGSMVIIRVSKNDEVINYYFNVYYEEVATASTNSLIDLEITPKKEISKYAGPGIACICFLIILFLYVLLFKKKKNK